MNPNQLLFRSAMAGTLVTFALGLAPTPARAAEPTPKSSSSKTAPAPPIQAPPAKGAAPSVKPPGVINKNLLPGQVGPKAPMYRAPALTYTPALTDTHPASGGPTVLTQTLAPKVPPAAKLPGSESAPSIPLPGPSLTRTPPSAEPPGDMKQELFREQVGEKAPMYKAPALTPTPVVTQTLTRTETPAVLTRTISPTEAPTVLTRTVTPTETSESEGPPPGTEEKIKPTIPLPSSSLTPELKK